MEIIDATKKDNYTNIDDPYNNLMNRDLGVSNDMASVDFNSLNNSSGIINVEDKQQISSGSVHDTAMDNIWIKNFIKSYNHEPGVRGFYIDGTTGIIYAKGVELYSGKFSTNKTGARVEVGPTNDITLYDDSTGGGGKISGDTAEIRLIRTDDPNVIDDKHKFILRRRAGKDNDDDNVLELISSKNANNNRFNVMTLGRDAYQTGYYLNSIIFGINTNSIATKDGVNGRFCVESVSDNNDTVPKMLLMVSDARSVYVDDSVTGMVSWIAGSGGNGIAGLGYVTDEGGIGLGFYQSKLDYLMASLDIRLNADNSCSIGQTTVKLGNIYTYNLGLQDGVTEPSTVATVAFIYVDTADGDLKVKFGDGVIKTLAVDA